MAVHTVTPVYNSCTVLLVQCSSDLASVGGTATSTQHCLLIHSVNRYCCMQAM